MMRCNNRQITKTHWISEFANCCAKQIFNSVHMKNKYEYENGHRFNLHFDELFLEVGKC